MVFYKSTDKYIKIDVFKVKDFYKESETPIFTIDDKKTLDLFSNVLRTSKKIPGMLDVASPPYLLEIYNKPNHFFAIYLFVNKESDNGMYIYTDKTETGYSISKSNTKKLKRLLDITD